MKTSRIEEAILSAVEAGWTKIAMVIGRVSDAMGAELPTEDERYELISDSIEVLRRAGGLEAQATQKTGVSAKSGDQTQKRLALGHECNGIFR